MKRNFLSVLLISLLCVPSLCADTTLVNVNQTDTFEHIVFLTDWDEVVADDKGTAAKVWSGVTTVPLKGVWIVLSSAEKRNHIFKAIKHAFFKAIGRPYPTNQQLPKGFAANVNVVLGNDPFLLPYRHKILENLSEAWPRYDMIAFYQQLQALGIPMIVATNNDYDTLMIKSAKLDKYLAQAGMPPFTFIAAYCAGDNPDIINGKAPNGMPAGFVANGKDADEYFEQIYRFVETELGYSRKNTLYVFIDDKRRNVERACKVAQKEGFHLLGVVRNGADKAAIQEMEPIIRKHAKNPTKQLSPKMS